MKYQNAKMSQDPIGHDTIIESIKKWWAKADQEVFDAAVLVNPFFCMEVFAPQSCFRQSELWGLFARLYRHFYSVNDVMLSMF